MMIRQDFQELPPTDFLMQILDVKSKFYLFLWGKKDAENNIEFTWKEVSRYYNRNCFRTNLRKLNELGLISYEESDSGVSIELVGWDDIED